MSIVEMYRWLRDWAAIGGVKRSPFVTGWYTIKCWWTLKRWAADTEGYERTE